MHSGFHLKYIFLSFFTLIFFSSHCFIMTLTDFFQLFRPLCRWHQAAMGKLLKYVPATGFPVFISSFFFICFLHFFTLLYFYFRSTPSTSVSFAQRYCLSYLFTCLRPSYCWNKRNCYGGYASMHGQSTILRQPHGLSSDAGDTDVVRRNLKIWYKFAGWSCMVWSISDPVIFILGRVLHRWSAIRSSRACSFGSQTMREFSEPVSRNRLGQGHR